MKRRLNNLTTIISLLLFVATVGFWVRSYWVGDQWEIAVLDAKDAGNLHVRKSIRVGFVSSGWILQTFDIRDSTDDAQPLLEYVPVFKPSYPRLPARTGSLQSEWEFSGIVFWRYYDIKDWGTVWQTTLAVPDLLPAFAFAILPTLWLIRLREDRRTKSHRAQPPSKMRM